MADDEKIIQFRDAAPSVRLKRLEATDQRRVCKHRSTLISMEEPILECADCGAIIDPHQWIRILTKEWEQVQNRVEFMRVEAEREMKEIRKQLRVIRGEYADEKERQEVKKTLMVLPPRKAFDHG